ncbi:MAG: zinc-binding dehydrogenase, partial [Acidimicrobiia bacterium]
EARDIPGLEFAGTVASVGERVTMWKPGDRVMSIVGGGGYATKLVIHERQALAVPSSMSLHDAAAVSEVFITAWDALVVQGGLTSGRRALVHAGASGVGTAAIQLCRALGASVAVTASAGKHPALRELGADLVVERSPHDWLTEVKAWAPNGVDVVLDVVGEIEANVKAARLGGRIIQVGVMGGAAATFPLGLLLTKRVGVVGTTLRNRPLEEKIAVCRRFADEVLPLFDTGLLRPVIDSTFPFEQIVAAHERMESNANIGKIVITMS